MFNVLEGHLGVFSDADGTIRSKVHNNDEDSDYDNHTITYSEKVENKNCTVGHLWIKHYSIGKGSAKKSKKGVNCHTLICEQVNSIYFEKVLWASAIFG